MLSLLAALALLPGLQSREVVAQTSPSESIALPLKKPEIDNSQSHVVSGRVVDKQGRGVAGVKIWLAIESHWSQIDGPAILGRAMTATDGSWQLTVSGELLEKHLIPDRSDVQVIAWHKDYYLTGVEFNGHLPSDDVTLTVTAGEPVQIELRGPEAGVLDGTATVNYVQFDDGPRGSWFHLPREVRETVAVKLAREFTVPAVRPGRHYSLEVNDLAHGEQTILTEKNPPNPWPIELRPVGTIEGLVGVPDGGDVDPTKIKIRIATSQNWQHGGDHHYGNASARPDRHGRFRLPKLASGSMRIFVTEPGNAEFLCVPPKNEFASAGETTSLTIPMQRAVRIKRQFVNAEGEPVPNVKMNLSVPNGLNDIVARSDELGTISASILPGIRYRQMYITPTLYSPIAEANIPEPNRTLLLSSNGPSDITLEPITLTRARVITGRLIGAKDPGSIQIAIGWTDPAVKRRFSSGRYSNFPDIGFPVQNVSRYTTVNKKGEFRYDRLGPSATVQVTPLRDGIKLAEARTIAPGDDPNIEVTLRDFQFVSLSGRVLDEEGKPHAGLALRTAVRRAGEETAVFGPSVKSDSEGHFKTPTTLPRNYEYQLIAVDKKGKPIVRGEWFSPSDGNTVAPEMKVPRQTAKPKLAVAQRSPSAATAEAAPAPSTSLLASQIVDSSGRPVQAKVSVWHEAQSTSRKTNADGTFSFGEMPGKVAWLFIDAEGYRYDGRYIKLGSVPPKITVYRRDEAHPNEIKPRRVSASNEIKELAKQKAIPFIRRLLNSNSPERNKRQLLIAYSHIDPQRALAGLRTLTNEKRWALGEFVHRHAHSNPAIAVKAAFAMTDATGRARSLCEVAPHLPTTKQQRTAISMANKANKEAVVDFHAENLVDLGESLLKIGERQKALDILKRAAVAAMERPENRRTSFTRSFVASKLAPFDLATAQELMQNLPEGRETGRAKSRMAHACITLDTDYAELLIASIADERTREDTVLKCCHALAAVDHRRALELSKQIQSDASKRAMARAFVTTAPNMTPAERGKILDESFAVLQKEYENRNSGGSIYMPMQVAVSLLPMVEQVLPERLHEFFWQALSFRGNFSTGNTMRRLGSNNNDLNRLADAVLGAYLSRYSAEIAESLTETPGDQSLDLEYAAAPTNFLGGMATYAPEKAIRVADKLPEANDSDLELKRQAWTEVLQMVGQSADERWIHLNERQYHLETVAETLVPMSR